MAVDQLGDWLKNRGHSMAVSEITSEDIRGFIGHVLDTRADATARQRYSSLAVLFKWLLAEGEIEADPMSKVTRPKADPPRVEIVTDRQFKLLLDTCDTTFLGRRDEAILWIFYDTGMRVSELCGLRMSVSTWKSVGSMERPGSVRLLSLLQLPMPSTGI